VTARDKPGYDHDEIEFAERKLAESQSRLAKYRALQNSFIAGSAERLRANNLIEEIEVLHQLMDQLCRQLRAHRH
jgi:hypothetical protein